MNKLQELMDGIQEWSGKTFGEGPSRIIPNLKHLKKEIPELIKTIEDHGNPDETEMEFADCFILLFQAAARYGLTAKDIKLICEKKMEINKKRNWGKPDKDGVVEHVRS